MILLETLLISPMKSLKMACVHSAALQFRQNSAASTLGSGSDGRVAGPGVAEGGAGGAGGGVTAWGGEGNRKGGVGETAGEIVG